MAAGASHSLALRSDGSVVALGANNSGQTNVPASVTNAVAISAGGPQSLALKRDEASPSRCVAKRPCFNGLLTVFTLLFYATFAQAQGQFVNLGFESAHLPPIPQGQFGSFVPISQALPGWIGFLGTTPFSSVLQNNFDLGSPNISIFGPNWTTDQGIIEGQYTVLLQTGVGNEDVFLLQNGLIPLGSQSLLFKAASANDSLTINFSVSFTGQHLSPIPLSFGPNYTLYGADISAFSGQAGGLKFTALGDSSHPNNILLDSFVFSPIPVPEPSTLALFAVGGILALLGLRRKAR